MVAGCELWRQSQKQDDGLEWARQKMRANNPDFPPSITPKQDEKADGGKGEEEEEANGSVLKIRVDQSWNVRLLWEGRVKELLVSAGVGVGPGSFSSASSGPGAAAAGAQSSGGGGPSSSYWRGVGVSVLYSS